jgi:hypothetical protein
MPVFQPQKYSYTLMELFVVLLIVGVLLGLLPKAFAQVLENSSKVACMEALKQLGTSTWLYMESYDNTLPHEDFGSSVPPYNACWYEVLDPFIPLNPKAKTKQDPQLIELDKELLEDSGFSFKMNSRLEDYKGDKPVASPVFRNIATIARPEKTILFFDGDTSNATISQRPYGMYNNIVNRHLMKANLLLIDGHVKSSSGSTPEINWKGAGGFLWDPEADEDEQ